MDKQPELDIIFSLNLSDEAAYEISEFLAALSFAFEGSYFGQITRHRRAIDPRQSDLIDSPWEDGDEPSF